jgi:hypothetical protein
LANKRILYDEFEKTLVGNKEFDHELDDLIVARI